MKKRSEKTFTGAMLWIIIIYKSLKEDGDAETVLETPNMNVFRGGRGLHAPHKMILHADSYINIFFLKKNFSLYFYNNSSIKP